MSVRGDISMEGIDHLWKFENEEICDIFGKSLKIRKKTLPCRLDILFKIRTPKEKIQVAITVCSKSLKIKWSELNYKRPEQRGCIKKAIWVEIWPQVFIFFIKKITLVIKFFRNLKKNVVKSQISASKSVQSNSKWCRLKSAKKMLGTVTITSNKK